MNDLPKEFIEIVNDAFGSTVASELCSTLLSAEQSVAIRFNPFKSPLQDGDRVIETVLNELGCGLDICDRPKKVPWCSSGVYLTKRPSFIFDPLFHAGAYYVQDPSAMYMEMALKVAGYPTCESLENLKVLDLCAAPGGKSTHLLSLLPSSSLLVSNEVISSRATVLAENIAKWGCDNVAVTNSDPLDFSKLEEWFDIIVADTPCSGEGMFRKDPNAVKEWSLANVKLCSERQQRILSDVWPALAPGGVLIYSTCTFNLYENDGIIEFLGENFGAEVIHLSSLVKDFPQLYITRAGGCQFIPGRVDGEGQYIAVVRKPAESSCRGLGRVPLLHKERRGGGLNNKGKFTVPPFLKYFIDEDYELYLKNDLIKAVPRSHIASLSRLERSLKIIMSGRAVANTLGAPAADLALSANISKIDIPKVELSKEEAIKFLQREPLMFNSSPKGYLLLTYTGLGLGFVKNLGNRSNSLLPMNRRILKRL